MTKIKKFRGKTRIYTKFGGTTERVTVLSKKDREQEKETREGAAAQSAANLSIEVPAEIEKGKYADSFGVSFKEGEFVIDFLKATNFESAARAKLKIHARVITSPAHAKRIATMLAEKIKNFSNGK